MKAKLLMLVLAMTGLATLAAGCRSGPKEVNAPSASAVAAELTQKQSGSPPGQTGQAPSPTQRSQGGSVTIDVTWENPKATSASLNFSVVMDTHSVDLDGYDLRQLAVLKNDRGQQVSPQLWDAPSGGHHRSGSLTFPAADSSGKPIVGLGVKELQMTIRDVAGVKERTLRWAVPG